MALPPFFERVYSALGGHLAVSRDDLTSSLQGVSVGIEYSLGVTENDFWIAELSANLLARLYPRLAIGGSAKEAASLRDLAVKINPNVELVDKAPAALTIGVGDTKSGAELLPNASGWIARLRHSKHERSGVANPYAAGAAATFAVAEIFRRVFLNAASQKDISVSLLNFDGTSGETLDLAPSDLGEVLFVAVGAIGNAALWALSRDKRRRGQLILIDGEDVDLSNLQRYVLAYLEDVSKQKVVVGQIALVGSNIAVKTSKSTLEAYADQNSGIKSRTICISVDNVATRRAAQALLPKLVINGWTGEQALGASWHEFWREAACLACLYHPQTQGVSQTDQAARALGLSPERAALLWVTRVPLSEEDIATAADKLGVAREVLQPWRGKSLGELYTDVVCGAAPISLPVTGRVETVPLAHQSALAGILMAAELVKRTSTEFVSLSQTETLVSWDDVLRPPPEIWAKPRAREKGCICGDQDYQRVYAKKWTAGC